MSRAPLKELLTAAPKCKQCEKPLGLFLSHCGERVWVCFRHATVPTESLTTGQKATIATMLAKPKESLIAAVSRDLRLVGTSRDLIQEGVKDVLIEAALLRLSSSDDLLIRLRLYERALGILDKLSSGN